MNDLAAIKRGRLSVDEEAAVERFASAGHKPGRVAALLNRHPATINYAFHRLGLKTLIEQPRDYTRRDGIRVKSFDPEEDAFIVALRAQRFSTPKIAELITKRTGHKRTAATILIRLRMLANREELTS